MKFIHTSVSISHVLDLNPVSSIDVCTRLSFLRFGRFQLMHSFAAPEAGGGGVR